MKSDDPQNARTEPCAPGEQPGGWHAVGWRGVLATLIAISLLMALLSYVPPILIEDERFRPGGEIWAYLNLAQESNLPTWWNATLLTGAAVLFLVSAWFSRRCGTGRVGAWLVLALLALALSLDDTTWLHERLDRWGVQFVAVNDFTFVWLVIGIPVALVVLAVVVVAALRLPAGTRAMLLVGFGLFFLAAIGFELIGGELIKRGHGVGVLYTATYHAEETIEMLSSCLIVVAPMLAWRRRADGGVLAVTVRGPGGDRPAR